MPGTASAPTVDGTPLYDRVSVHYVDASGDIRSDTIQIDPGTTDAQIQTMVGLIQGNSNASIYKVERTAVYASAPNPTNAVSAVYPSVYDNVVLLFKTLLNQSQNIFIPAPDEDIMPADSDSPDTAALIPTVVAIINVLEGTGTTDWSGVSARFTERREKNQRVLL